MTTQRNPAQFSADAAWVASLFDRLAALERRVRELEQEPRTYLQPATVTTYVSGNTCTVTFTSGDTAVVPLPAGYTPSVGHVVDVLVSPYRTTVVCREA